MGELTDSKAVIKAIEEFDSQGRENFLAKYGFGRSGRDFIRIWSLPVVDPWFEDWWEGRILGG